MRLGELDLLKKNDPRTLATSIGLVYQDPGTSFNPALRIGSQLTEVSRVHLKQSKKTAYSRMVKALADIRITEPETRMKQHPHELSGGMLQRAMIASTLVTDPRLIIADEPTTALDVTVQADVLRQFRTINREMGTAMLFISHDIGVVQALCDKVIVMNGGKILERLTGAQLAAGDVKHPYTKALLAATPSIAERKTELVSVRAEDFTFDEITDEPRPGYRLGPPGSRKAPAMTTTPNLRRPRAGSPRPGSHFRVRTFRGKGPQGRLSHHRTRQDPGHRGRIRFRQVNPGQGHRRA